MKNEIERKRNWRELPGFEAWIADFLFSWVYMEVHWCSSLDWFGLWSWKHCLASFGSGSFAKWSPTLDLWSFPPMFVVCLCGGNLVRCVSCSPLPVLNTSLFASLFYTLSQDLLGRLGPVDWTSGLRDAVDGSRMMPSFGRLVLFCTFVLFWLVCWYALSSLYSRHFCVVW